MLSSFSQIEKFVKQRSHEAIMAARIISHAGFDKKKVKETQCDLIVPFIQTLRKKQPKCHYCDELMTDCQGKGCLWQWSVDRIDNTKGHTMDNVRLTCYYCNIRQYGMCPSIAEARLMKRTKTCQAGCHVATVSRDDPGLADIGPKLKRSIPVRKNKRPILAIKNTKKDSDIIQKEKTDCAVEIKHTRMGSRNDFILLSSILSDDHPLKNTSVRVIVRGNNIFYYAQDLCVELGITNPTSIITKYKPSEIVSPEQKKLHNIITTRKYKNKYRKDDSMILLTEWGAYRMILNATGPLTDKFREYTYTLISEDSKKKQIY